MTTINAKNGGSLRRCAWVALGMCALGTMAGETQGAATDAQPPRTHTVLIDGTSFQPARLTVGAGDTVVWINKDPFPHTATSTSGAFDSGGIAPDKSWRFTTAKTGDFDYVCTLHPTMKARLMVE